MFTLQTKKSILKALITKDSPFYIQFYVSNACHLQCKMCNIVEANSDLKPFKTEHIEQIADNLVKIGAGVVLLTGGEPFLRHDIDEIVRVFKSKKLDVRLQTAGLISKKDKIAKCAEYGARDINVSIDSLDENLSDYINGVKGSWKKAMESISFISKTFPSKDSICALGCVLSNYNIDEIEAVLDFATEIGWWLSLVPVHITETSNPLNFRGYDEYFKIKDTQKLKALLKRLKKKKRQGYTLFDSDDYLDSIYHFVTTGKPNWRHDNLCDTPNIYFAIMPDGRFAPCCDHRLNKDIYLYDANFPKIYKSKKFRRDVKQIAKKCPGCNFGSFPEMTLTVRSLSTVRERVMLQLKTKHKGIRPLEVKQIHRIIEVIKKKYPVYNKKRELIMRNKKKWPKANNIPKRLWKK